MASPIPPPLEVLDGREPHAFEEPRKRINNEDDMERFKWTRGFNDIGRFIMQLNHALCPRRTPIKAEGAGSSATSSSDGQAASATPEAHSSSMLPPDGLNLSEKSKKTDSGRIETFTLHSKREDPQSVKQLQALLEKLKSFIDEAPPSKEPRRFGNASFRVWHQLLEERADGLLKDFLPEHVLNFPHSGDIGPLVELRAYFLGSFGSATRLDYGTGHELSFLAFLGCMWKLGGFKDGTGGRSGDIERSIVFGVFEP
jgi:serine/threonine-protein phosphatase 2A activator